MKKILFFIRALTAGGAERQLVVTAKGLSERGYKVTILTFYSGGFYANELVGTKVRLLSLHKKGRWDLLRFSFRLLRELRQQNPDVIYSFLSTANMLSVILKPFISPARVVWGVRASNMDLEQCDWLPRWNYRFECKLSRFTDHIIANSNAGLEYAVAHGFPGDKMNVIANGIDTARFKPDQVARGRIRKAWNVDDDTLLIGLVGRVDPMKGYPVFLEAAKIIKHKKHNVRFVCVGEGAADYTKTVHDLAVKLNLDDVLIWAGKQSDMVAVYNAIDILVSSSLYGEGFPNVLGEAMSCGVPCVVTDVGDSALIVGEVNKVVEAGNSKKLAQAICNIFPELSRKSHTKTCRLRIEKNFSRKRLIDMTEQVLNKTI